MDTAVGRGTRSSFLVLGLVGAMAGPGCGGSNSGGAGSPGTGGTLTSHGGETGSGPATTGGAKGSGGAAVPDGTGGASSMGGSSSAAGSGGKSGSGGSTLAGGTTGQGASGGTSATGSGGSKTSDAGSVADAPQSDKYVVAMLQSSKANAADLTTEDVVDLVSNAVTQAGGLDFIKAGQTVVLKPNLVTAYTDHYRMSPADKTVNGISTDWRVVNAVADLVRAKVGSTGKILVMEGSTMSTTQAYSALGYTKTNMSAVDELIAIEGSSCSDRTTSALVQKTGKSGTQYWVNKRYVEADVVISIPTLKTHSSAGITGAVKNLGIGTTPIGQFSGDAGITGDCTRSKTAGAGSIDHSTPEALGSFIRDYYSIRPADFVVMDGLQGIQHGPSPAFDLKPGDAGYWDYASSRMNMRLILAGRNPVAVDTVEALVMKCDPKKVPHLTKLEADGLGTTDISQITVVGKQLSDVAKPFACKLTDICPGT
jgi:uncharacterized protein (DUF362 family)